MLHRWSVTEPHHTLISSEHPGDSGSGLQYLRTPSIIQDIIIIEISKNLKKIYIANLEIKTKENREFLILFGKIMNTTLLNV